MGSHNTSQNPSRRGSTNESIDTEDEWYKHEIRELEQEEYEKNIEAIKPSPSLTSKLSHVLIELTATVAKIESEDCQKHDKAMKAKQNAMPGPAPLGGSAAGSSAAGPPALAPPTGMHVPLAVDSSALDGQATSDEDHKRVIMRFQGSEDFEEDGLDLDLEDEEESSHAKRKGRRGRSDESSENDSDATQSGPDSLMEDTGGSSAPMVRFADLSFKRSYSYGVLEKKWSL